MKCPNCKNKVIQRVGDKVRLRVKGQILFEDDMCKSTCFWCGADINFYFPLGDISNIEQIKYVVRQ